MKFEIRNSQSSSQRYYARIVASNGAVLFTSETYHNKRDAVQAANSVKAYGASAQVVDLTMSPARSW